MALLCLIKLQIFVWSQGERKLAFRRKYDMEVDKLEQAIIQPPQSRIKFDKKVCQVYLNI